jgi:signal transduction histidine kinase
VPVAVAGALAVRRRFPVAAAALAALGWVLVGAFVAMPLASYTVASRRGNGWVTWLVTAATLAAATVPWGRPATGTELSFHGAFAVALIGVPALYGLWVAQRRQLVLSLRERAEQAERERDLRAASAIAEERTRIARELHDVVAHRVSQIAVQAGALAVSSDGRAAEVAEGIRGTSRTALEEMRELLGVLRRGYDAAPLHPAPTLDGLRQIVDEAVAEGQRVRAGIPAELPAVAGSTGRAVYRLVQESLTNAAKHAPGAEVDVTVGFDERELTVSVRNAPGVPAALRTGPSPESRRR